MKSLRLLCSLLLLALLIAGPAQAQKTSLALSVEEAVASGEMMDGAALRQHLLDHLRFKYEGNKAMPVKVYLGLFDADGRLVKEFASDPFTVRPGAEGLPADKLPDAGWFPGSTSGGAAAQSSGGFWDTIFFWRRIAPVHTEEPETPAEEPDKDPPLAPGNLLGQIARDAQSSMQGGGGSSNLTLGMMVMPVEEADPDRAEEEVRLGIIMIDLNTGGS